MVEVSLFVGICSIYRCTAVDKTTLLLLIMAMARYSWQVFDFFSVVCVGKGFQDELLENSDLLFSVRRVF